MNSSKGMVYVWHGLTCKLIVKPIFKKGIKRNALIELEDGARIVVPWRALRRPKKKASYLSINGAAYSICPDCDNMTFLAGGMPLCTYCGWSEDSSY